MADLTPKQQAVANAPKVFRGWEHLRGALRVGVPVSLHNTDRIASGAIRTLRR